MKILWLPQFSSVKEGKYYIASDSNYSFAKNLIPSLLKVFPELEIFFLLPWDVAKSDYLEFYKFAQTYEIKISKIKMTTSVFGTRYSFDYEYMKELIEKIKPDYIWENNPVHARALKTILWELKYDTKILVYYHWIDSPDYPKVAPEISYWYRQIEGAVSADLIFLNSHYALAQICTSIHKTLRDVTIVKSLVKKMYKVPPIFDSKLFEFKKSKSLECKGIIFNHRLSSLSYYKDNFNILADFMEKFIKKNGWGPKVYFTNPSRKEEPKVNFEAEFLDLSLPDYYKFLGSDKVTIAPNFFLHSQGMWSISTVEAGLLGNAVILPYKYGYMECAPKDYSGFFKTKEEAYQLFEKVLLDNEFKTQLIEEYNKFYSNVNGDKLAKKVMELLKRGINNEL